MTIPSFLASTRDWMRIVAVNVNRLLQGNIYLMDDIPPDAPIKGYTYYDVNLDYPRTWNGAGWINYGVVGTAPGTVTSVQASGGTTGLSFTGGPITTGGTLTLAGTLNVANGGTGANGAANARTNLGLVIGSDVQAYSTKLAAYAGGDTPSAFTLGIVDSADAAAWRTAIGAGTSSTTGTVTSVSGSVPTGFSIAGSPITTSGTLAISFSAGYSLPTDASQANWTTAYGWGNHATAGYAAAARTLTAGAGLTGGGTLAADRTFAVGAGTGITVNADDVAIDTAVVTTLTGSQTLTNKTLTAPTLTSPTVSGTSGNLYSTKYTPTLTNVANGNVITAYACRYIRIDNEVRVSGKMDLSSAAGSAVTVIGISLPVASAFTAQDQCSGTASEATAAASYPGAIRADATNDRAEMVMFAANTSSHGVYFEFSYEVI